MHHEYIFQEVSSYTRKPTEFDKYIGKKFTMSDKIHIGKNVVLTFDKSELKVRLDSIEKIDDTNKLFCINTNKFVAIIKAIQNIKE